jgi:hypothetical protein
MRCARRVFVFCALCLSVLAAPSTRADDAVTGAPSVDAPAPVATENDVVVDDRQGEPPLSTDARAPVVDPGPVGASPWAEGLDAEFGKGVTLTSSDGRFSLTTRGRVQFRASATEIGLDDQPVDLMFQIRRARLVFMGQLFHPDVQFYIQLGLAPTDMEPDLLVPLRDAALSWTPLRDVGVRVGQMKVPFNRERVISSSALQFTDRSIVNAELTLDRDIGVQIFSNDLFGLGGALGYQVGVFSGDGRNRLNRGMGLLYVARVQVQPLGRFDDAYAEADLLRTTTPRFSFGAGAAFNQESRRQASTHGAFYERSSFDEVHGELDFIAKWWGFSLQSELLFRQAASPAQEFIVDGVVLTELPRSGTGLMVQAGYLFPVGFEVALRIAAIEPLVVEALRRSASAMSRQRELTAALGWYIIDHNLKVQGEVSRLFADDVMDARHVLRLQVQLFF